MAEEPETETKMDVLQERLDKFKKSMKGQMMSGIQFVHMLMQATRGVKKKISRRIRPETAAEVATRPNDESCHRGRSSTLLKTARLYRRASGVYDATLSQTKVHIHPRHKRRPHAASR